MGFKVGDEVVGLRVGEGETIVGMKVVILLGISEGISVGISEGF